MTDEPRPYVAVINNVPYDMTMQRDVLVLKAVDDSVQLPPITQAAHVLDVIHTKERYDHMQTDNQPPDTAEVVAQKVYGFNTWAEDIDLVQKILATDRQALTDQGYVIVRREVLISFLDEYMETIEDEFGLGRKIDDPELRAEFTELFERFGLTP